MREIVQLFGQQERRDELGIGQFAPWWIYRGSARIERTPRELPVQPRPSKVRALRTDLTLYRLTLGQPRQEDMVEILRRRGVEDEGCRC